MKNFVLDVNNIIYLYRNTGGTAQFFLLRVYCMCIVFFIIDRPKEIYNIH